MKIHEYQGKELLKRFGVPVPRGLVARSPEEARRAAAELGTDVVVVKAQIHAGGRGKGGGVKLAKSPDEAAEIARTMLGMKLVTHQTGPEGREVRVLLIEEGLPIDQEFYLGIVLDRASGRLARYNPFDHLYLRTIMMVLASVATTPFSILFLFFSLPSCLHLRATPFSAKGVGACTSSSYSSDTSLDTDSRSGYCTSTRTFHIMCAPSFSSSSDVPFVFLAFALFFVPNMLPPPTVAAASRPTLADAGTGRVGHAPGLSPCVSSRTWWRLPHLGYLGDEESRSEILDNQGP